MADVQFPIETETEEMLILESAWFPDYSRPPKSDRRWIREGDKAKFTSTVARNLREQGLAMEVGIKVEPTPEDLRGKISNAAWGYLGRHNYDFEKIKEYLHGTGPMGVILLRDVTAYLQQFAMPEYQASY